MKIIFNYFIYCAVTWIIFVIFYSLYLYKNSRKIKKSNQYKRIIKKLDLKIENAVMNRCYKVAEKNYKKLEKVKRIWKGE